MTSILAKDRSDSQNLDPADAANDERTSVPNKVKDTSETTDEDHDHDDEGSLQDHNLNPIRHSSPRTPGKNPKSSITSSGNVNQQSKLHASEPSPVGTAAAAAAAHSKLVQEALGVTVKGTCIRHPNCPVLQEEKNKVMSCRICFSEEKSAGIRQRKSFAAVVQQLQQMAGVSASVNAANNSNSGTLNTSLSNLVDGNNSLDGMSMDSGCGGQTTTSGNSINSVQNVLQQPQALESIMKRLAQVQNWMLRQKEKELLSLKLHIHRLEQRLDESEQLVQEQRQTVKALRRTIQQDLKIIKTMATQKKLEMEAAEAQGRLLPMEQGMQSPNYDDDILSPMSATPTSNDARTRSMQIVEERISASTSPIKKHLTTISMASGGTGTALALAPLMGAPLTDDDVSPTRSTASAVAADGAMLVDDYTAPDNGPPPLRRKSSQTNASPTKTSIADDVPPPLSASSPEKEPQNSSSTTTTKTRGGNRSLSPPTMVRRTGSTNKGRRAVMTDAAQAYHQRKKTTAVGPGDALMQISKTAYIRSMSTRSFDILEEMTIPEEGGLPPESAHLHGLPPMSIHGAKRGDGLARTNSRYWNEEDVSFANNPNKIFASFRGGLLDIPKSPPANRHDGKRHVKQKLTLDPSQLQALRVPVSRSNSSDEENFPGMRRATGAGGTVRGGTKAAAAAAAANASHDRKEISLDLLAKSLNQLPLSTRSIEGQSPEQFFKEGFKLTSAGSKPSPQHAMILGPPPLLSTNTTPSSTTKESAELNSDGPSNSSDNPVQKPRRIAPIGMAVPPLLYQGGDDDDDDDDEEEEEERAKVVSVLPPTLSSLLVKDGNSTGGGAITTFGGVGARDEVASNDSSTIVDQVETESAKYSADENPNAFNHFEATPTASIQEDDETEGADSFANLTDDELVGVGGASNDSGPSSSLLDSGVLRSGGDGQLPQAIDIDATTTSDEKFLFPVTRASCQDKYGDVGLYTGTILVTEALPHGEGTMNYETGRVYSGEWVSGQWHGKGSLLNNNGDRYQGEFCLDARHGKGVYTWDNGDVYTGSFLADKRHGKGKFSFHNGNVYEGEFVDGMFEGFGRYDFAGGYYEGEWKEGRYHGAGELVYSNGAKYTGDFRNSVAHGFGVEITPDGRTRRGVWEHGNPVEFFERS